MPHHDMTEECCFSCFRNECLFWFLIPKRRKIIDITPGSFLTLAMEAQNENSVTTMLFQTCMILFLWNTKKDILRNVFVNTVKANGVRNNKNRDILQNRINE